MAGRPSVQSKIEENLDRIERLIRDGYTEKQCAQSIGVAYSSFMEYKKKMPELVEVLKKSKEYLIEELEDTLYRRALGKCKTKTTKKYIESTPTGDKQKIEETETEYPPDVGALCFALKNLAPNKWKDRRDIDALNEMQKSLENSDTVFTKMKNALASMSKELSDE